MSVEILHVPLIISLSSLARPLRNCVMGWIPEWAFVGIAAAKMIRSGPLHLRSQLGFYLMVPRRGKEKPRFKDKHALPPAWPGLHFSMCRRESCKAIQSSRSVFRNVTPRRAPAICIGTGRPRLISLPDAMENVLFFPVQGKRGVRGSNLYHQQLLSAHRQGIRAASGLLVFLGGF